MAAPLCAPISRNAFTQPLKVETQNLHIKFSLSQLFHSPTNCLAKWTAEQQTSALIGRDSKITWVDSTLFLDVIIHINTILTKWFDDIGNKQKHKKQNIEQQTKHASWKTINNYSSSTNFLETFFLQIKISKLHIKVYRKWFCVFKFKFQKTTMLFSAFNRFMQS